MVAFAILSFLALSACAIYLLPKDDPLTETVITFPIRRSHSTRFYRIDRPKLRKRDGSTLTEVLQNGQLLYYANITIGTPPQRLSLQIDTGSSDIWTQVSSSVLCNSQGDPCSVSGTYNNLTSSSYQYVNSDFLIQYGDGTGAQGDYCKETLGIAGVSINGVQIALGLAATSTEGVLGIGYSTNQAISIFQGQSGYPSLLDNMVSKKLIAARAFSLYLDDLNANTGSLLFGGIDTAKYSGDLLTLPVLNDGSTFTSFAVAMTSLSITKPGSNSATTLAASSFPISVILDSGSSWNSLPSAILVNLASELGATYSKQLQGYVLKNCDLQFQSGTINFSFGSAIIRVPFDEMIVNVEDSNGNPITYKNGQPVCQIGALVSNTDFVLGDTFLRSAYVVYDLDNNEIGIAQTKFNTTDSAIVALGSTNAGIPNSRAASSVPTITSGANVSNARPSSVVDGSATITVNASAPRGKSAAFSLKILSLFQIALVVIGITTANILCI